MPRMLCLRLLILASALATVNAGAGWTEIMQLNAGFEVGKCEAKGPCQEVSIKDSPVEVPLDQCTVVDGEKLCKGFWRDERVVDGHIFDAQIVIKKSVLNHLLNYNLWAEITSKEFGEQGKLRMDFGDDPKLGHPTTLEGNIIRPDGGKMTYQATLLIAPATP